MFGNWLKWKSIGTWWHNRGPVTRMTTADKARQTVDTICRLKARIAALESENAVMRSQLMQMQTTGQPKWGQDDNH
jgi:hypothetical protein